MDARERKDRPMATGFLDYFPDAMMEVAHLSKVGNDQHNPGQPLHWAKEKSTDHPDALLRHLKDRGSRDSDGERHSAKVAWRAMAMLQREIELERGELMPKADFRQMTRDVMPDLRGVAWNGEGGPPSTQYMPEEAKVMIRRTSEDRSLWRPMDRTEEHDFGPNAPRPIVQTDRHTFGVLSTPYAGDESVAVGGGSVLPTTTGQAGSIAMQWSPEADRVIEPYCPQEAPADTPLNATEPWPVPRTD